MNIEYADAERRHNNAAYRSLAEASGLPEQRIYELAQQDRLIEAIDKIPPETRSRQRTRMTGRQALIRTMAKRWPRE